LDGHCPLDHELDSLCLLDLLLMLFFGGEGKIWGDLQGTTLMRLLPDIAGDLHGAKILLSGILFTVMMQFMILKHGFSYPRDDTIIEAPVPTENELLFEHKADLIMSLPPFRARQRAIKRSTLKS
jgi:hypothetical protein